MFFIYMITSWIEFLPDYLTKVSCLINVVIIRFFSKHVET